MPWWVVERPGVRATAAGRLGVIAAAGSMSVVRATRERRSSRRAAVAASAPGFLHARAREQHGSSSPRVCKEVACENSLLCDEKLQEFDHTPCGAGSDHAGRFGGPTYSAVTQAGGDADSSRLFSLAGDDRGKQAETKTSGMAPCGPKALRTASSLLERFLRASHEASQKHCLHLASATCLFIGSKLFDQPSVSNYRAHSQGQPFHHRSQAR